MKSISICPVAMVVAALAVTSGAARADEAPACNPACEAGQTCVQGVCMAPVPSPNATAAPTPDGGALAPQPPAPVSPRPPNGGPSSSYAYPPPYGYAYPPPYGYPQPAYSPPPPPSPRRARPTGMLLLPYVGISSFDTGNDPDPGLRIGSLLGGRASDTFSANAEVTFDKPDPNTPPGISGTLNVLHATLSPLFHLTTNLPFEIVIGPKLGAWFSWGHLSGASISGDIRERGWTLGANLGLFFPVGSGTTALGVLLSYANLQATQSCLDLTGYGYDVHECRDPTGDASVFGVTFGALL